MVASFVECYECGMLERFEGSRVTASLCSACRGECLACGKVEPLSCLYACALCGREREIENEKEKVENEKGKGRGNETVRVNRWCADCMRTCCTDWSRVCHFCSFECHLCGNAYCVSCAAPNETKLSTCMNCSKSLLPSKKRNRRNKSSRNDKLDL